MEKPEIEFFDPEPPADLVVTEPGRLSDVRAVLVSGHRVEMPANDW